MSLANSRLKENRKPKITRLPNGRLRVERRFQILHEADTWNDKLTLNVFGGYGLLDGSAPEEISKDPREHRALENCRLVEEYTEEAVDRSGNTYHNLHQTYETLTSTFVNERSAIPGKVENGLQTLAQPMIALPDSPLPAMAVGSTATNFRGVSLTLARIEEDPTDAAHRIVLHYMEPGILRTTENKQNNGKLTVQSITAWKDTPATPDGFVYVGSEASNTAGAPTRTYRYAKGEGEIRRITRKGEAGIEYLDITYLTAPDGDQPTPADAGDILTVGKTEATGHLVWTFNNIDDSDYDGSALVDSITAQKDGAIVVVRSAWNTDPDVADLTGYYQTSKKTKLTSGGKKTVLGTWVKPPANYSETQTINFKAPGWADVSGSELVLTAGVSNPYAATISHTFTTTAATAPTLYSIAAWASFQINYKYLDADGKEKHYFDSQELPGYLGNSGWAGTSAWAGQDVEIGAATVISDPVSAPTGNQNLSFVAAKYLTSITGQTVYRNTTTTITL